MITPRNIHFTIAEPLGSDWNGQDWFRTAFFNAMSILFPYGEKSFIDSVRANESAATAPALKADIRGFMAQEYVHRREHQRFNEALCSARGYSLEWLERGIRNDSKELSKLDPLFWLATTVAYEHLTATIAGCLLGRADWLSGADAGIARMWRWHAIEEIEHKSVAFDLYIAAGGTRAMLRKAMVLMSVEFLFRFQARSLWHMFRRDRPPLGRTLAQAVRFMLGKRGLIRGNWRHYWAFFRRDFHPDNIDDTAILERAIEAEGLAYA